MSNEAREPFTNNPPGGGPFAASLCRSSVTDPCGYAPSSLRVLRQNSSPRHVHKFMTLCLNHVWLGQNCNRHLEFWLFLFVISLISASLQLRMERGSATCSGVSMSAAVPFKSPAECGPVTRSHIAPPKTWRFMRKHCSPKNGSRAIRTLLSTSHIAGFPAVFGGMGAFQSLVWLRVRQIFFMSFCVLFCPFVSFSRVYAS